MSESYRPPYPSEAWVNQEGLPVQQLYEFAENLSTLHAILSEGIFPFSEYADLSAVTTSLPNPINGMTVIFTGQGLGRWKQSITTWVLCSDDITAVI